MAEILVPYKVREPFKLFHTSGKRWSICVAHRRSGKTTACVNHLIKHAMSSRRKTFAYIAPTYVMAKRIAFEKTKFYAQPIPRMKFNESELRVEFPTGSQIYLLGAENPDSLRGIGLSGVVLDEASQQPANLFSEIVRPALMDNEGWGIWIGTPKGRNEFFKIYDKRKDDPEWFSMLLKASESGILPQSELENARKTMSEDEFEQEMECSFTAAIKGAVYGTELKWLRDNNHISKVPVESYVPVDTYWDLGIADYTAVLFMQSIGSERRIIDFYQTHNQDLSSIAKVLDDKGYWYGTHYLPHDANVRELQSGRTRKEFLETRLKGLISVVKAPKKKEDAIQAVKLNYKKLWINSECETFLSAFEQYQMEWDEHAGVFKRVPLHNHFSHAMDALTTWALSERSNLFMNQLNGGTLEPDTYSQEGQFLI